EAIEELLVVLRDVAQARSTQRAGPAVRRGRAVALVVAERGVDAADERLAPGEVRVELRRLLAAASRGEHVAARPDRERQAPALGLDVGPDLRDHCGRIAGGVVLGRRARVADDGEAELVDGDVDVVYAPGRRVGPGLHEVRVGLVGGAGVGGAAGHR